MSLFGRLVSSWLETHGPKRLNSLSGSVEYVVLFKLISFIPVSLIRSSCTRRGRNGEHTHPQPGRDTERGRPTAKANVPCAQSVARLEMKAFPRCLSWSLTFEILLADDRRPASRTLTSSQLTVRTCGPYLTGQAQDAVDALSPRRSSPCGFTDDRGPLQNSPVKEMQCNFFARNKNLRRGTFRL